MLSIYLLAEWAQRRAQTRIMREEKRGHKNDAMLEALAVPISEQLLTATIKHGPGRLNADWLNLFLALPERLLSTLTVPIGNLRRENDAPSAIEPSIELLTKLQKGAVELTCANLSETSASRVKNVLLCHGLSPTEDSLALLAELGRSMRLGATLDLGVDVMLLDWDWQLLNRSSRQIQSLEVAELESGLKTKQQQRMRLYQSLGFQVHLVSLDHSALDSIVCRLHNFAERLWQVPTSGMLSKEQVERICQIEPEIYNNDVPIIRYIAKQFVSLDADIIKYLIGQFWAQVPLHAHSVKVAAESESKFDEAFEKLYRNFRQCEVGKPYVDQVDVDANAKVARIYAPHYRIGRLRQLSYTPFSLDMMKVSDVLADHSLLAANTISVDADCDITRIIDLLRSTPFLDRNRLLADVSSFIIYSGRRLGPIVADDICCKVSQTGGFGFGKSPQSLVALFEMVAPAVAAGYLLESEQTSGQSTRAMLKDWRNEATNTPIPGSVPVHLYFSLLEESDWKEDLLETAACICVLAIALYRKLAY
jgi:hypothetical protein